MRTEATVTQIADAAGVSASTVSRALRRPELVKAATRVRVLEAAAALGYQPNPAATALITGRTDTLGLVVPDLENPFFATLVKAAAGEARRHGYGLVLADTDEDAMAEEEIIAAIRRQVDGLLVASSRLSDEQLHQAEESTPLILVNRELPGIPSLLIDDRLGMRQAVQHLSALGHRVVAYAGGPTSSWSNSRRHEAFLAAAGDAGIEPIVLGPYAPRFDGGIQAADMVLAGAATAVISYNDVMAFGVISRLQSRGTSVPGAISVIGFDDIPTAAIWSPPLTTITASTAALGKAAVQSLLQLATGKPLDTNRRLLASHLVIRSSTGVH